MEKFVQLAFHHARSLVMTLVAYLVAQISIVHALYQHIFGMVHIVVSVC
jgi:hypothetical protein